MGVGVCERRWGKPLLRQWCEGSLVVVVVLVLPHGVRVAHALCAVHAACAAHAV